MVIGIIHKIVNWGIKKNIKPLITCFLIFGLPVYFIISIYLLLRSNNINANQNEIFFLYTAISWVWIGAISIWYYDKKLVVNFISNIQPLLKNKESCNFVPDSIKKYRKMIMVPWVTVVIVAYLLSMDYMVNRLAFSGFLDLFHFLFMLVIVIMAALTGIGFCGVINTFVLIYKVYKHCDLVVDPYNIDELGGLSIFGHLTIRTTMLFSTGALCVPILIIISRALNPAFSIGIYSLIGIFSLFILLSFIAPNYLVYKKAKIEKDEGLVMLNDKLRFLSQQILYKDTDTRVLLLYNDLRNYYQDLKNTSLFPFNTKIFISLISSVIFPAVMIFVEKTISKFAG